MMTYEDSILEAFTNIVNTISKLSFPEQNFIKKNLRFITDHLNRTEAKNSNLVEKSQGVEKGSYDDALEYFGCLMMLHGYTGIEINNVKFKSFVSWFSQNALNNPTYKSDRITKFILKAFLDAYCLFCIEYTREPESYVELRDFLLKWEDIIDAKVKKEIDKLTADINSLHERN